MSPVTSSAGNGASPDQRSAPGTPNGHGTPEAEAANAPERVIAAAQRLSATRALLEAMASSMREYRGVQLDRNELTFVFDLLEEQVRHALDELHESYPGFGQAIAQEVPR